MYYLRTSSLSRSKKQCLTNYLPATQQVNIDLPTKGLEKLLIDLSSCLGYPVFGSIIEAIDICTYLAI